MEKVVINVVIHAELRFLTWIFQAGSTDRTEVAAGKDWAAGEPGHSPAIAHWEKWFRSLLGSEINSGMHKATQPPPRHALRQSPNLSQQQQHALFCWMPPPCSGSRYRECRSHCPSHSCACRAERKKGEWTGCYNYF